ncbi:MAG: YHS domain-containing protein [bacterium]
MKVPRQTEFRVEKKKRTYFFCSSGCLSEFRRSPEKYIPIHKRKPAFTEIPSRFFFAPPSHLNPLKLKQ